MVLNYILVGCPWSLKYGVFLTCTTFPRLQESAWSIKTETWSHWTPLMSSYARQFNDEKMEKACWKIDYNAAVIVAYESSVWMSNRSQSYSRLSSDHLHVSRRPNYFRPWMARLQRDVKRQALLWTEKINGASWVKIPGEDLLKQFRFSLISPTEFSDEVSLVMPTDILFLTEVVLACVASVSSRVIARKLEREQKKKMEGPSPSPLIPSFFAPVPTFSTNSRGNACYAG